MSIEERWKEDDVMSPHEIFAAERSIARARSVFSGVCKEEVLGLEEIWRAVGVRVDVVPTVSFPDKVLEIAAAHDMSLVFEPTMLSMEDVVRVGGAHVLNDTTSYKGEEFFYKEHLPGGWRLMGRVMVPGSNNKRYREQTPVLVDCVRDLFGDHLSTEMLQAIKELDQCRGAKANEMLRPLGVEALWHGVLCRRVLNIETMLDTATWTRSEASSRRMVAIGLRKNESFGVGDLDPTRMFPQVGACLALGPQVFRSK